MTRWQLRGATSVGTAAAAAAALLLGAAQPSGARLPSVAPQFKVHSIEVDDTSGGTVVLTQLLVMDPVAQRSRMVADGSLLPGGAGHMEQILRCDGALGPGGLGYFVDIEGAGAAQQCVNMSRTCTPFVPFWDFPANTSDLGPGHPLPPNTSSSSVAAATASSLSHRVGDGGKGRGNASLFHKFEYWLDQERYELYTTPGNITSAATTGSAGEGEGEGEGGDVPVWMGKVSVADPQHHLWHFEYTGFEAGPAPASDYAPPKGIVCRPQQQQQQQQQQQHSRSLLAFPARAGSGGVAAGGGPGASTDPILANLSHYEPDCHFHPLLGQLVCAQRPAASDATLRVACVGDSITAVGHTSSKEHQYPSQLQELLDAARGNGTYSVTNLGTCGTTLSKTGASPYWDSATYRALVAGEWDVVIVMLGTNDARDVGSGGPEHWPRSQCDDATAATLDACPFAQDYAALLDVVRGLGRNRTLPNGTVVRAAPEIYIMIPPALMKQGAYGMNQTIINTIFPRLVPLIGAANADAVTGVIDVYHGLGGVTAPGWETAIPKDGCTLNSTWPPCAWYCDAQSCAPGQCHPNDVGCSRLAHVVKDGWLGNSSSSSSSSAAATAAASVPTSVLPSSASPSQATIAAVASRPPSPITVPHLTGIFVALDSTTAGWSVEQWVADLQAMQAVGIEWFCLRAVAKGATGPTNATAPCPLGTFGTYFPYDGGECYHRVNANVDAVGNALAAAKQVGVGVHLGLSYPTTNALPTGMNTSAYYKALAWMNWDIAAALWTAYGDEYGGPANTAGAVTTGTVIQGWYTDLEESNVIGELAVMEDLVGHYLEPLARDIHNMTANNTATATTTTSVWASPYYVFNLTRHAASELMTPRFYADWWGQIMAQAPHLDFIAPQDSMGAQGNSFTNVSTMLTEFGVTMGLAGRRLLSNVELFEVWPAGCDWSPATGICKGRHPAPFERVKAQMANEAPLADELIAWEWHSCLSPFGASPNWTRPVYEQYRAYVAGAAATARGGRDLK